MVTKDDLIRGASTHFAEMVDGSSKRIYVGCVMAAGSDWVEVSAPALLNLGSTSGIRLLPSLLSHAVAVRWRSIDRVGLQYLSGGPPDDWFAGIIGMNDSRSAEEMRAFTPTWMGA